MSLTNIVSKLIMYKLHDIEIVITTNEVLYYMSILGSPEQYKNDEKKINAYMDAIINCVKKIYVHKIGKPTVEKPYQFARPPHDVVKKKIYTTVLNKKSIYSLLDFSTAQHTYNLLLDNRYAIYNNNEYTWLLTTKKTNQTGIFIKQPIKNIISIKILPFKLNIPDSVISVNIKELNRIIGYHNINTTKQEFIFRVVNKELSNNKIINKLSMFDPITNLDQITISINYIDRAPTYKLPEYIFQPTNLVIANPLVVTIPSVTDFAINDIVQFSGFTTTTPNADNTLISYMTDREFTISSIGGNTINVIAAGIPVLSGVIIYDNLVMYNENNILQIPIIIKYVV